MNGHSIIIHESPKVKATLMPNNWWTDKQNVVELHSGLSFAYKKNQVLIHATWTVKKMLSETRKTKGHIIMIPFIWNVQNKQINP